MTPIERRKKLTMPSGLRISRQFTATIVAVNIHGRISRVRNTERTRGLTWALRVSASSRPKNTCSATLATVNTIVVPIAPRNTRSSAKRSRK